MFSLNARLVGTYHKIRVRRQNGRPYLGQHYKLRNIDCFARQFRVKAKVITNNNQKSLLQKV